MKSWKRRRPESLAEMARSCRSPISSQSLKPMESDKGAGTVGEGAQIEEVSSFSAEIGACRAIRALTSSFRFPSPGPGTQRRQQGGVPHRQPDDYRNNQRCK
jgi:hypothetical protein